MGKQVLLVDLMSIGLLWPVNFTPEGAGLTNVLVRNGNPLLVERYAPAHPPLRPLVLLAGTHKLNSSDFLRLATRDPLFAQLRQSSYDYVLFDAPPGRCLKLRCLRLR